jgi:NAD(P)-dependent dehydrogenase (short-subunit alcohol dehydrogenase family)
MEIVGKAALVTGGASGLGAATARELARRGAKVAVLDRNAEGAAAVAAEIGEYGQAVGIGCDITASDSVLAAIESARALHGPARLLMNVAGIGSARRIVGKDGSPAPLEDFERVVRVNLIGTYNVTRLVAAEMVRLEPLADGERGVIVNTASVAAFDGQVGQEAYAASKAGVAGMTLPLARDLAQFGVRVCTIAPGLFLTPLLAELPQAVQESLAASIPFPKRLGKPEEFALLCAGIIENLALNGETIRLDGALRMAPR